MADIILSPIAELIIEALGSAAVEEIKSLYGARGELSKLESTLSTIRAVLVDAEKRQIRDEQVKDWLEKLEAVFFDADDLVDEVAAEGLQRKLMHTGNKLVKKVRIFFSSNNQFVFRCKMAREIKSIRERLDAISVDKERFHFVTLREEIQPARGVRDSHSFVDEKTVVGRDKDRRAIIQLLLDPENEAPQEEVSVIPIVGMGGLGKTTLAQLVFNDERVQKYFELRIWVCVSNDFSVKVICEKILKIVTGEKIENLEMEQLQRELREKIKGKRYLLVLDDVWSEDGRKWKELKDLLSANCSKGSRIIVTTRHHKVADVMSTMQPYELGILDPEESWNLFKKMADHKRKDLSYQMVDIAKEILAKCAGLPLALSMIGSVLLSSKNPEIDWSSFLENELPNITKREEGILSTLKLSYDYLPSHLKTCFAYCSLFPKDHEFDVQTLIILWVAQGFIRSDPRQSPEELGYEYFSDLLWRSFFQEAKNDDLNMVKTCKMHDLVHDLAIQVAVEKYAMLASWEDKTLKKSVRHVSLDFNSLSRAQPGEGLSLWLRAPRLRSFLLPSEHVMRDTAWEEVVSNLKFLRMLDLHLVGFKKVPSSIRKLKHLRYLDLSGNDIQGLPASITKLVNLQTLKLNWCDMLCELPSEIEKLVNLRHLELEGCDSITHMPRGLGQLTNLQTLSQVVLGESIPDRPCFRPDELMGLNNLRGKLEIKGIKSGMVTTATKLIEKKHLQSLTLSFERSNDDASSSEQEWKTTLEGLQPHPNLRVLYLLDYGGSSLSSLLPTLTNLVRLRLNDCLKCQQLPSLDQFHSLKEMELYYLPSLEYITINEGDNYFSTSSSQSVSVLPSLQELTLYELPKFRGWWRSGMAENQVEQLILPSFPRLSSLSISHCEKLTSMPRYPNIEGELRLRSTSWKTFEQTSMEEEATSSSSTTTKIPGVPVSSSYPLSKLTILKLIWVTDLEFFPAVRMKGLASLEILIIEGCHGLKYLSTYIQYLTSLEDLDICDCEEFEGIKWPETPALTSLRRLALVALPKVKHLVSPAIQYLTSLEELHIQSCEEFEGIKWPETPALTSLRKLELWRLPKLKHLVSPAIQYLTSLQELSISDCEELQVSNDDSIAWKSLTSLHSLKFEGLPQLVTLPGGLQFLTSLRKLELWRLQKLKHLVSPAIQYLTSLQHLAIGSCEELQVSNHDSSAWQSLTSLHSLKFVDLPQLVTVPGGLQFLTTLKDLDIRLCHNFTSLPDWICKLSSLQSLEISGCPNFKSVPGSISSLTSLQRLEINDKEMNPREIHEDLEMG